MKFYRSIRFKLVVFSILIEATMLTLLILNSDRLIVNNLTAQTYKQIDGIKSNLQATLLPLLIERDYASLDSLLNEYTNSKKIPYVVVVKDDKIITKSNWSKGIDLPIQDKSLDIKSPIYNTSTKIVYFNQEYGNVFFGVDISFIQNAQKELFTQSTVIALVEIFLSIILLFSIAYLFTQNLTKLTTAAQSIIENKFDISLNIKSKDELGLFGRIFDKMAKQINAQIKTIQEQHELKKAIFDNMAHILMTTDTNGIIKSFNKQAQSVLGYEKSEVIDIATPEIFYDKNELKQRKISYSKDLNEQISSNFELLIIKTKKNILNQDHWRYITKNQKEIIVKVTVTSLKNSSDEIYGYIIVAEDKTEKYLLEQSLLEETNRLKFILSNAGDFIHILDKNGNVVMFSDSFANSLGYTNEEAKKLNVIDWDSNYESIETLLTTPRTFETVHKRKDGTTFEVEVKTTGMKFDDKIYLYAASRDITERKKAEEELRKRDTLIQQQARLVSMGEMIGNIAHQWRQPLSMITTLSTGLKLKSEFDSVEAKDIENFSDNIVLQANYLSQTIDNFRSFIKNEKLKEEISIKKTLESAFVLVDASLKNNFINLYLNIKDDFVITGNTNELTEAFINLLNNSKDVLKEKDIDDDDKIILISSEIIEENKFLVKIQDSGKGIDISIIDRIFEPYFTTKHKSQGTGLGLSMVDKIITERHNGTISVVNEEFIYDNKKYFGACFYIYFSSTK